MASVQKRKVPWLANKKTTQKKEKPSVKIVNPIFEQAAQLAEDPFWKKELENASQGKFPRGFMYRDGIISYKKGSKITQEKVPQENALTALYTVVRFFQERGNIRSRKDKEEEDRIKREQEESSEKEIETWRDIRKENIKEQYLNDYVDRIGDRYALDGDSRDSLLSLIHFGIHLGYISADDIILNNLGTCIEEIKSIRYVSEEEGFALDCERHGKKTRPPECILEITNPDFSFLSSEKTYLEDIKKKYAMKAQRAENKKNSRFARDPEPITVAPTTATSAPTDTSSG